MNVEVICGVDEAGRGALAGSVVAAAVILGNIKIDKLQDSKKLSPKLREELSVRIANECVDFAYGIASVKEIEEINILNATMIAMQRAIGKIVIVPDQVLVDGNKCPDMPYPCSSVVGGDASVAEISAASVLAKVERDRLMRELAIEYPCYGFDQHKGYGTESHLEALSKYGAAPCHRAKFSPVKNILK